MGRKKKSVLNQSVKEPVIKEEPEVVEEITQEDMDMDKYDMTVHSEVHPPIKEQKSAQDEISLKDAKEISLKVSGEKLSEVLEEKKAEAVVKEEIEEPVVEGITITKPSKEQLSKLSKSGLRWYQRTGMLPK